MSKLRAHIQHKVWFLKEVWFTVR